MLLTRNVAASRTIIHHPSPVGLFTFVHRRPGGAIVLSVINYKSIFLKIFEYYTVRITAKEVGHGKTGYELNPSVFLDEFTNQDFKLHLLDSTSRITQHRTPQLAQRTTA